LENPAVERWRKLRGLGSLDRKRLAVVRELFAWREEVAERQNRPARTVLRDDLIVEVARRGPKTERDLQVLRGLPKHDHAAILDAVRRGRATPPEMLPALMERDNDPPQVGQVTSFILALLGDLCSRWALTPGLVTTNHDVKLLVRARWQGKPPPAESTLTHGWRGRHLLSVVQAILEGRQGVRVGDVRAAAPFAWDDAGPPPRPVEAATD
jgi:ribonuclease D